MAKLFLDNDTITISEKLSVFGSSGSNDKLKINNTALGSTVNANVETLQFTGKFTDYTFAIAGNQLQIGYQGSLLATVGIQSDSSGTQLAFSDVTTAVNITGMNQATIGKAALTTSLNSYTNAQLDGAPPVSSSDKAPWTLVMKQDSNLLVSNGTAHGTNTTSVFIYSLATSQDKNQAYYTQYDYTAQKDQLWTVTGTNPTPTKLADVSSSSLGTSYTLGNFQLFAGGSNLIATDGTSAHTFSTNFNGNILKVDPTTNTIWHTINTAPYGTELYKTVLTDSGFTTSMVKDIYAGSASGFLHPNSYWGGVHSDGALTADGKLIFSAHDGVSSDYENSREAWVSDGTEAGTFSLDLHKGSHYSDPSQLTAFNGKVAMSAYYSDGTNHFGRELVITDGTIAGTKVLDINPGSSYSYPTILGTINNKLYFTATDATGKGLFSTDGTTFTKLVAISDSNAQILGYTANKAYFAITDATHGQELWSVDLTATTPTIVLVKDILAGSGGALSSTYSDNVTMIGDKILFNAYTSATNQAWFVSDGTNAGTVQLASSLSTDKAIIGNKVFFANSTGVSVADVGAASMSATLLKNTVAASGDVLQSDSDQAFFLAADEKLYASTGTNAIELASNVDKFKVVADNAIYFIETNSSNVASLWYSDGTASGTRYIEDLTLSASSYDLANAVAIHTVGVAG